MQPAQSQGASFPRGRTCGGLLGREAALKEGGEADFNSETTLENSIWKHIQLHKQQTPVALQGRVGVSGAARPLMGGVKEIR